MWPASEMLDATGTGLPSEPYWNEMGPALKLASQTMISLTFEPPGELDVKRSYATSATMEPEPDWDQCHVVWSVQTQSASAQLPTNEEVQVRVRVRAGQRSRTYRHAADRAELPVDALVELDVREALHAGSARPGPVRPPRDGASAEADEVCALRAARRAVPAPLVEQERVLAGGHDVPLAAVRGRVDALAGLELRGGGGREERRGEKDEGECLGEHGWSCSGGALAGRELIPIVDP